MREDAVTDTTTCIDNEGHVPLVSDEGGPVHCRKCQAPLRGRERADD